MEYLKRNKSIFIDKEAIFALLLCQEGLLYPVTHLMNEAEMNEVDSTGLYKQKSFPFSFILAPSGRRNEEVIKNAKEGEIINIICERKVYGYIKTSQTFKINKQERLFKIMSGDIYSPKAKQILHRLGNYAICGDYEIIISQDDIFHDRISKSKIPLLKKSLKIKKATSMVLNASPVTRIHEQIFRLILDNNELLVLMLLREQNEEFLDFEIRKKCLEYVIENFLPKNKVLIVPLDDIYLFAGAHGIILESIISQNMGCDKIMIGQNYPNLTLYYDNQKIHSIFDTAKDIKIKVKIVNEFFYCNECYGIVSNKTCPHGQHHHITYDSGFIQGMLKSGLIPPTLLVRKEVSAKILSHIFPDRFSSFIKKYSALFANRGIIEDINEEDFYIKIADLYKMDNLN
ncbi:MULTISPECIES: sulfate adenylyltransferase [Helicobacter]|uniref:Sulfate adenylyltransferase n=1 Tax=Helicobacter ibis TaxID=2962633 RepID=A0ABT4VCW6_9HELI|nr:MULTISPECIES: sulfate adenylyltransferase [Helicobacter]MDA3966692.1 sulfate adenylyltransferase [Helicobacter sp. WB40]MDA3968540.1 sulfate adenylyltransferase [Helicobacter ibis]